MPQQNIRRLGQLGLPPRRARVVKRDDKISQCRGLEASPDRFPRRHQIRQRDHAKIMAERRAGPRGGRLKCRNARNDPQIDHAPFSVRLDIEQLEDEGRQAVDAGVSGGDQRHRPSFGGEIERQADPRLLVADRARIAAPAFDRAAKQVEIKAVTDHVARLRQRHARLRTAPARIARPDADNGEPSLRAANRLGNDRLRCARDRASRAPRFSLWHDQHPVRPGGGERRAFGDAPTAGRAESDRRALRQARRLDKET